MPIWLGFSSTDRWEFKISMRFSDIQFNPPTKTLRQFAGLWLVVFGGMAVWEAVGRHRPAVAASLAVLALVVGPMGLARPDYMRPIYVGWMVLAFPIGWTVSQVVLLIVFFGLFTPIGILFRVMGRDPLDRKLDRTAPTYWTPKPAPTDLRRYFKQF